MIHQSFLRGGLQVSVVALLSRHCEWLVILIFSDRFSQLHLQVVHIDFLGAGMLNDTHQSCLQVFDVLSLRRQFLKVICKTLLGHFEGFVLVPQLLAHIVKLLDLAVGKVELLLGSFDVCNHVGLGLVGLREEALAKFDFGFQVLDLAVLLKDVLLQFFILFLLGLQAIGKQKGLLDSSLGCSWSAGDGLNQGVADSVGSIVINSSVSCNIHNGLVQFLLDELIVSQSFLGDRQLGLNVR